MTQLPHGLDLVEELVAAVPALAPLWEEHLSGWGEPLPYLFMPEIIESLAEKIDTPAGRETAEEVLDFLENKYQRGDETDQTLIVTGFLESVPRPDEPGAALRTMLPPLLAEALRRTGF